IPCFGLFSKIKYLIGLKIYDWLSGKFSFGSSVYLNKGKVLSYLDGISAKNISGGIEYYDGQFDDARLAVNLAQTAIAHGATVLNYAKVTSLTKDAANKKVTGLKFTDVETDTDYIINAKAMINATGVFVDDILS